MPTPTAYNSWIPTRADAWSRLEEASRRIVVLRERGGDTAALEAQIATDLALVSPLEQFFAFPGTATVAEAQRLHDGGDIAALAQLLSGVNRALVTEAYRSVDSFGARATEPGEPGRHAAGHGSAFGLGAGTSAVGHPDAATKPRPHFEVLVVGRMDPQEERDLRARMLARRRPEDPFTYDLVVVGSGPEALLAIELNATIQACLLLRDIAHDALHDVEEVATFLDVELPEELAVASLDERPLIVADRIAALRPELDIYLLSEMGVEDLAGRVNHHFRRVFHAREGALELHLSIISGVAERYAAPFFEALRAYAHRPRDVFHALPISQGKSILGSHWIGDMVDFYGLDIFLAETSATGGGLDSLLEPTGPLRDAQKLAAEAFGSRQTYFVTNGTSTANKIVAQALVAPGDIVLVDRNCHQSHHYGMMLAGAHVTYLEAYPLDDYTMYGAVPLREIKAKLLALRAAGKLDRVKMVMLTNCTFDGIVYDVQRVMEECLAIKPDLAFLWDEAWFAFARFHPIYRRRTGMRAARTLTQRFRSPAYEQEYARHAEQIADADDETLLETRLLPDPQRARVRVYATQSTHKTLTSLRQGSMIHVHDQDFAQKVRESFHEAYMAHTSTSPNYQVLASLDLGRRQVALEGYELVQRQIEYAMRLRDAVDRHPLLSRYVHCLTTAELIPGEFRPSGIDQPLRSGRNRMEQAWAQDEFVLDPSRISLYIGATGIDGATFKREQLMDRFGIQVNKTSRNTVLFMTNIGTTRSSVAYLIEVLVDIVRDLEERRHELSLVERVAEERRVERQTTASVRLPDFSAFHPAFRDGTDSPEGDVRAAFYLSYDDANCDYVLATEVLRRLDAGEDVVSATFVTPYPPGFPVLVPGQVFTREIVDYLIGLDTPEIHGYVPEAGFRVYVPEALARHNAQREAAVHAG